MEANIVVLPGDGIGPEIISEAVRTLECIADRFGHTFNLTEMHFGGAAIDAQGDPLPQDTLDACKAADAILLGAVGGPKWDAVDIDKRPEKGLLRIRKQLGLFANIRPAVIHEALLSFSPLKPEVARGTDILVMRELTGGIYFGKHEQAGDRAVDECVYTVEEVERIARLAGQAARAGKVQGRKGLVTSVDKSNVLATSRLWREVVTRVFADEFSDVQLEHQLVDSCAMRLVSEPAAFDVIVTENMFGDILTDQAAALSGTLGVAPSASTGDVSGPGLFEPIHGSAPDIAGKGIANPYGTILSAAMLLRIGLGLAQEAQAIEAAVSSCLADGVLTGDLASPGQGVTTQEAGDAVLQRLAAASVSA